MSKQGNVEREEAGFHEGAEKAHTRQSGLNDGKSERQRSACTPQNPSCPECGNNRVWRAGCYRGRQRWLCRSCGFRFSESSLESHVEGDVFSQTAKFPHSNSEPSKNCVGHPDFPFEEAMNRFPFRRRKDVRPQGAATPLSAVTAQRLNILPCYSSTRRVCVTEGRTKNLARQAAKKVGLSAAAAIDIKGMLIIFFAKSELAGLKRRTIECRLNSLKLLIKRGANLLDPACVFQIIDHAKRFNHKTKELLDEEWSEGSKKNAAQAYKSFCEINDIAIPKYINFDKWTRQPQKLPWVPLEREVDALVAGCSKRTAAFLQILKETGMRCGEAWRLKWTDVDTEHNVITINNPEKQGVPRQLKISGKLAAMINALSKTSQRVFGDSSLATLRKSFMKQRHRIAFKLQNPRLNRIKFHTLRHWKGTMEYHKTKDILHVKELLGHRNISSTLIYTHLVNFEGDEYTVRVAKILKEDEELLKAGFEYVTERDGVKIYRKRK